MADLAYTDDNWLGETPKNWPILPAKSLFSNPVERNYTDDIHLTPSQKYGVLPQTEYMEVTGNRVVLNLSGADNMRHVEPGDFVSHLRSFQGGLEYSPFRGKVSSAYTVLRPRRDIEHRYYKYLFKSDRYVQGLATTTEQLRDGQSIRYEQFALLRLPNPPLEEQKAIADFLERELAQIDTLIQRLEELAQTINRRWASKLDKTMTYGISGSSTIIAKDKWIAELPVGWKECRLKHLLRAPIVDGPHTTPEFLATGYPFLSVDAIQDGELDFENCRFISEEDFSQFYIKAPARKGDLLLGKAASTGKLAQVKTEILFAIWSPLALIRLNLEKALPDFVEYALKTSFSQAQIETLSTSNTQKNISMGDIPKLSVALPPIGEQLEIVQHLNAIQANCVSLTRMAKETISKLLERRSALISAAVTGKINVRGKN